MIIFKLFKWMMKGTLIIFIIRFYAIVFYAMYYLYNSEIPYKTHLFIILQTYVAHTILLVLTQKIVFNKKLLNSVLRIPLFGIAFLLIFNLLAHALVKIDIRLIEIDYLAMNDVYENYLRTIQRLKEYTEDEMLKRIYGIRLMFNMVVLMFLSNLIMVLMILNKKSEGAMYRNCKHKILQLFENYNYKRL